MIKVFNCGHDSHHKKPCDIFHPTGLSDYLFLLVKHEAWVYINNVKCTITPNSVLLFPPGTPIHYGCDTTDYNDDWIHFDLFDTDADLMKTFAFSYGVILQPHDFSRLSDYTKIISSEFYADRIYRESTLDRLMHIFLCALDEELKKTASNPAISLASQKYYQDFVRIRTQIHNSPSAEWSTNQLAATLCLSCSHFHHLYRRFFGCSCQHDIILSRIELAKFYLTTTDMSIYQLSLFCGYKTDLHFMRQFKKYTGTTPTEYRLQTCSGK